MTSRTVSGSVNTTSLIRAGVIAWAASSTICARRHVTTDPDVRRTIRKSRLPSSLEISRSVTLAAKSAPSRRVVLARGFDAGGREPRYGNPANVGGRSTSARLRDLRPDLRAAAGAAPVLGVRGRARAHGDGRRAGPRPRTPG